ncbi:MAG: hypothetical protein L0H70_00955 [Xanthomonadales bacterium]|nr:hypothetical protein [Xanthomonadales bacterium]
MPALTPTQAHILRDPLPRLCLRLALPALVVTVLHGVNLLIDMVWAGHLLGTSAATALSVAYTLNHLLFSAEALVATGAAMTLSHALGAGKFGDAARVYRATSALCLLLGVVLMVLGYAFARPLLAGMGLHGPTLQLAWDYYGWFLLGMPLSLYAFASSSLLQGHGALTRMTWIWVAGIALNALLTPCLMILGLGIRAAALGCIAGQVLICIGNVGYLRYQQGFSLSPLAAGWRVLRRMLGIGQSGFALQIVYFVQAFLVFYAVGHYGDAADTAVMGAAYRLVLLGVYIATGFSRALQPVLGMSMGAGDEARARRALVVFNAAALVAVGIYWLPLMLAPSFALHLILPSLDLRASQVGDVCIYFAILPLLPFLLTSLVWFQSSARAAWVTWLGLARLLLLFVPAIWLLPQLLGVRGVYWSLAWMDAALFIVVLVIVARTWPRMALARAQMEQS